jgi:hypothetical protein
MSTQPSERKDGFGTEGIGEGGDGAMGIAGTSGSGGTASADTGGNQRGGNQVEGAFGEHGGAKGRRSPANKQGLAQGDGNQD